MRQSGCSELGIAPSSVAVAHPSGPSREWEGLRALCEMRVRECGRCGHLLDRCHASVLEVTQQGAWKINDDTRGELTHSPLSPSLIRDDHTRVVFFNLFLSNGVGGKGGRGEFRESPKPHAPTECHGCHARARGGAHELISFDAFYLYSPLKRQTRKARGSSSPFAMEPVVIRPAWNVRIPPQVAVRGSV